MLILPICNWLCVIDVFSKYACVSHLNDKKGETIAKAFEKRSQIVNQTKYGLTKAPRFATNQ